MTLARTPYARLSPADIGQVDRELKKLEQMSAGLYVPKVLVAARSPYTVQGTDTMLLCDCTAGAITLTFPLAARVDGMCVQVVKSDTSTNAVTLTGTFSGVTNPTITVAHAGFTVSALNGVYHVTALVTYPIVTGETGVTSIVPPYGDLRRHGGAASASGATNRAAFQAAQTSAASLGGAVIIPPGTFSFGGANIFTSAPIWLQGLIKPANGQSFFIQNPLTADISKHFDTSLGGVIRLNGVPNAMVYAEWWGAVGDNGITDDTTALQQAIDSCAYNNGHIGGVVQLCNSGYGYTILNLMGSVGGGAGVELKGVGRYSTTLFALSTGGVSISMNGTGCRLSDLRIQTAVSVTPLSTQIMVSSTTGANCTIERTDFYKYYNGVQVNGVHMRDCFFDYGLAGGIGVDMTDSIGSTMEDVVLTSRYAGAGHFLLQGVSLTPDTNLFTRCSTNGNLTADLFATYGTPNTGLTKGVTPSVIMKRSGIGGSPRWSRFTDCLFETTNQSSFLHCFQYLAGQDTKVTGGYILGGTHAVDVQGATADYKDDLVFESTIIQGANLRGVYHNPADTTNYSHVTLGNCTVVNNSASGAGGWPGVELGANSRGFTMRGGTCGTTIGVTPLQQFGVLVNAGAQDYLIDIDSIDFTGNTAGPIAGHTPTVASAGAITPVAQQIIVSGVAAIATIIVPRRFRQIRVIPTGIFTWTTTDNIAVAGTAVVGKMLVFTYEQSTGKFYPSYTA